MQPLVKPIHGGMMSHHAQFISLSVGRALRPPLAPAELRTVPVPTQAPHSAIAGAGQPTGATFQGDPLGRGMRSFFASASLVSCKNNTRNVLVWQEHKYV